MRFGRKTMMDSGSRVDMDDWKLDHQLAAAVEGWCIVEVGLKETPSYLVVRNVDDETFPDQVLNFARLDSDEDAVESLRHSWINGTDHAVLAYSLLKLNSPAEFYFWRMLEWGKKDPS